MADTSLVIGPDGQKQAGIGTFVKVQDRFVLRSGHVVCFGTTQMVIGIMLDKAKSNKNKKKSEPAGNMVREINKSVGA